MWDATQHFKKTAVWGGWGSQGGEVGPQLPLQSAFFSRALGQYCKMVTC